MNKIKHVVHSLDFDELYEQLEHQMAEGRLKRQNSKEGLSIYSYSKKCVLEKTWNLISLVARGLILDIQNKKVIATPFPKFFNHGESEVDHSKVIFEDSVVTEKLDGSLLIVFWNPYSEKWDCATKGSFYSEQAIKGREMLSRCNTENMIRGATYLFEIIYRENRIVVKYDYEDIVLLGAYLEDGTELNREDLVNYKKDFKVANIKKASSVKDLLEEAKKLDSNHEGWVLRFKNGYRVKIKGEEYLRLHRIISLVTPLTIWGYMNDLQDIAEIRKEIPEEFLNDFDTIVETLSNLCKEQLSEILTSYKKNVKGILTNKEVGLRLQSCNIWPSGNDISPLEKKCLFCVISNKCETLGDTYHVFMTNKRFRKTILQSIRPKSNVLNGYVPSSSVNRFVQNNVTSCDKTVYIMRGIPGSGKSTAAQKLMDSTPNTVIVSADNYFTISGKYVFDAKHLTEAHLFCKKQFELALKQQYNIVVDNTNLIKRNFSYYTKRAFSHGYNVEIVYPPETQDGVEIFNKDKKEWYVDNLVDRGVHNTNHILKRMIDTFQWEIEL